MFNYYQFTTYILLSHLTYIMQRNLTSPKIATKDCHRGEMKDRKERKLLTFLCHFFKTLFSMWPAKVKGFFVRVLHITNIKCKIHVWTSVMSLDNIVVQTRAFVLNLAPHLCFVLFLFYQRLWKTVSIRKGVDTNLGISEISPSMNVFIFAITFQMCIEQMS